MPYFKYKDKNIYYEDKGQGIPLVILPGNTASSTLHKKDIEYFSNKFRVISPDYIGYGKSSRLKEFSTDFWWTNAIMVTELLKYLYLDKYILIGTSGGGIIGLNMAIQQPQKVLAVVVDSFIGEFLDIEEAEHIVASRQKKTRFQQYLWQNAHGEDWEDVIKKDSNMLIRVAKEQKSLNQGRLNEVKCPVLFTASLKDELVSSIEDKIINTVKKIKHWKIVFYPKGNHPLMWSKIHDFREEVEIFLHELNKKAEILEALSLT